MLDSLRAEVARLHQLLPANHLVAWTSGNISARDPKTNLVVIKPSGVTYDALTPESLVVVDLEGRVVEGPLSPSSDTLSHCYIYRHLPKVNAVVHTHSRYATAFAALGREIPCVLTAIADEFGGPIPCAGLAPIGGDEIGSEVVACLSHSHSPAVLLQNHGVFTTGTTAAAAVKAAVMTEDNAAIVWCALALGQPLALADDLIARLHQRYTEHYGQRQEASQ
ncbi:MAG: L-ribulose-5-phosphate 4-epimerase [Ktedonobacterales bacterium]